MKNETQEITANAEIKPNGKPNRGTNGTLPPPTPEQVTEWVKRDLQAAAYFLNMLLKYPEIIEECAKQIYEHTMQKESGAGINHEKNA